MYLNNACTFAIFSVHLGTILGCKFEGLHVPDEEMVDLCFHPEFYKGKNQLVALTVRKAGVTATEVRKIKLIIGQG